MRRVPYFGLTGGALGIAIGLVIAGLDDRSGGPSALAGISAALAGLFGLVCALLYRLGSHSARIAVGFVVAALWLEVSIPLYGLPASLPLLAAALYAFVALEERRGQGRPSRS